MWARAPLSKRRWKQFLALLAVSERYGKDAVHAEKEVACGGWMEKFLGHLESKSRAAVQCQRKWCLESKSTASPGRRL